MLTNLPAFTRFLIEAKLKTYAGSGVESTSTRPASKDLPYRQDDYLYLDTYLGGFRFIGEEAVWEKEIPVWGMNYYGCMTIGHMPDGFSHFLKESLQRVLPAAPYRGPAVYQAGPFEYRCEWSGEIRQFEGREKIFQNGSLIYELIFHGGEIV